MENFKKEFTKLYEEKIREEIKEKSGFEEVEKVLENIDDIKNIKKNEKTKSPLDMNYEFTFMQEQYMLRMTAVNKDYKTKNKHSFPGVLQLLKMGGKVKYVDNLKKQNPEIEEELYEGIIFKEYSGGVEINNMPIMFGDGHEKDLLNTSLEFWLMKKDNLENKGYFELENLSSAKSDNIYKMVEEFLETKDIIGFWKKHKGVGNSRNFAWYSFELSGEEKILSPLTYNNGGIY